MKKAKLDLTKLYGFKIVAFERQLSSGGAPITMKIGAKDGFKIGGKTGGKIGGKFGEKAGGKGDQQGRQ